MNSTALKEKVFSIVDFAFDGEIVEQPGVCGTYVKYDGKTATVGFSTIPQQARCYFLLSMHIKNGEENFEIRETPAFDTIGPMLDVSRGKVMRVDAVKKYIDVIVALGMNMLMLYTEDLFELEEYPMFGYLRGKYTIAELQEIDDYADSLGMEVIPCIQTLGHLKKYLRWREAAPIKEFDGVLLVDEPKTYEFIEAEIKAMRKAFRSKKIHLGMDEAYGLGLSKYFKLHGYKPEAEIFYAHLNKVLTIAAKYFERPMIWSDMLFNNPDGIPYYDQYVLPQERIDGAPNGVDLVFWDYYHSDFNYYNTLLTQHRRFKNEIVFGGGLWTWDGIVPNFDYTYQTMKPAIEACFAHGIKTFIITEWLSGGAGADFMQAVPGLTVFSEYCYKGQTCTETDIYRASAHIAGVDEALFHALSAHYIGLPGARSFGKASMFGDPLVNLVKWNVDFDAAHTTYQNTLRVLQAHPNYKYNAFYTAIFEHGVRKLVLWRDLKNAYRAGDQVYLTRAADEILPEAIEWFDKIYTIFKEDWKRDYKIMDIMMYTHSFGAARQRMVDAIETIHDYLNGKTNTIEELEQEVFETLNVSWQSPQNFISNFI